MTQVFAHRGYHAEVLENTVAAVERALALGADGVEVDVWRVPQGDLVVHHDRWRGTQDLTRADANELGDVAHLGEILSHAGDMRVNVEVKATRSSRYNRAVAGAVAEYLDETAPGPRTLVSSFSLEVCREVRRLSPRRRVGWLTHRQPALQVLATVRDAGLTSAHLPFAKVTPEVAAQARREGIELHVWTPNLRRDVERMIALEVGAVITDDVPLALELRGARQRESGV